MHIRCRDMYWGETSNTNVRGAVKFSFCVSMNQITKNKSQTINAYYKQDQQNNAYSGKCKIPLTSPTILKNYYGSVSALKPCYRGKTSCICRQ